MTGGQVSRVLVTALALCLSPGACRSVTSAELADFKSDGCSMFPDGDYFSCCYLHDVAYWPGGTAEARELADKSLRTCVSGITGNTARAEAMYKGVHMGG